MSELEHAAPVTSASLPFVLSGFDGLTNAPDEHDGAGIDSMLSALESLGAGLSRAASDLEQARERFEELRVSQGMLLDGLRRELTARQDGSAPGMPAGAALPFALGVVEWPRPRHLEEVPALRVRLLGRFEVEVDGRMVTGWRGRRARQLFAYLLLNRHEDIGRHRLMGVFWPEHSEERAENNLSLAVLALRRVLDTGRDGPSLVAYSDGCYRIAAEDVSLDTEALLELAHDAAAQEAANSAYAAELLDEAIALYAGDLMPADLYEEWTQRHRRELQDAFVDALQRRAALARRAGDTALSIRFNRRLLDQDPASEDAHRHLILDYLASGQRSRAHAQVDACTRALRRHLGVGPSRETLAVFAQASNVT